MWLDPPGAPGEPVRNRHVLPQQLSGMQSVNCVGAQRFWVVTVCDVTNQLVGINQLVGWEHLLGHATFANG
jgi:hypothetical protein